MPPETTWEDLKQLTWLKQKVYKVLKAQNPGIKELALNEGFAKEFGLSPHIAPDLVIANTIQLALLQHPQRRCLQ
jgi:hypothetical protein